MLINLNHLKEIMMTVTKKNLTIYSQKHQPIERIERPSINRKSHRQAGFILSGEVLIYLAIALALAVIAAFSVKPIMSMYRTTVLGYHLKLITTAVDINYSGSGVYTTLSLDEIKDDLPNDWSNGATVAAKVNPFGGDYSCTVGAVPYIYSCTATGIGIYDSKKIIKNYGSTVQYDPSTKIAVFSYGEV